MGVSAPIDASAALLVLAGILPERSTLLELRARHALLVAADGAAIALDALGIVPDVVIGDLDSIGELRSRLADSGVMVIEELGQETNDFEKALNWIADRGLTRVTIVGIDGGMIDHTLNNFSVLAKHAGHLSLEIRSGEALGWAVTDRIELACAPDERISLIPLPSARVTTRGLAWELSASMLAIGAVEGASNRALGDRVVVDVHEGTILVVHYPGR